MNLHDLRLFDHLAVTLHFGKTSRACHVSPSTLSRVIQRLEEEAGAALFIRDNRHVELTAAGKTFKKYAEEAIDQWERIRLAVRKDAEELEGDIRLYSSVTAGYSILPDMLRQFRQRYSKVQITLITGDASVALDKVQEGATDLAVAPLPDVMPDGLEARTITRTPLIFIGPTEEGEVTGRLKNRIDWAGMPMIVPETGLMRTYIFKWFRDMDIRPNIYAQVSGHEAIISLVSLGFGIGVIPELVLDRSIIKPEVAVLPVKPMLPEFVIGLCTRKTRLKSSLIQAFWQVLED